MQLIIAIITVILCGALLQLDAVRQAKRENLFDPLYAFDEIDAHTVKAGDSGRENYYRASNGVELSTAAHNSSQRRSSSLPPLIDADYTSKQAAASTTRIQLDASNSTLRPPSQLNQAEPLQKRQSVHSAIGSQLDSLGQASSPSVLRTSLSTERPKHWSALENYYQKLRDASLLRNLQAQPQNQDELSLVYSQQATDERLSPTGLYGSQVRDQEGRLILGFGSRPDQLQQLQQLQPNFRGQPVLSSNFASQTKQNFELPFAGQQQQQQLQQEAEPQYVLPVLTKTRSEPNSRPQQATKFDQLAPFILGTNGLQLSPGGGSVKTAPYASGSPMSINGYSSNLGPLPTAGPAVSKQSDRAELEQLLFRQLQQQQQRPIDFGLDQAPGQAGSELASPLPSQLPSVSYDEQGKVRHLELGRANELLRIRAMQQRLRHQQETFGDWYDHRGSKELLQEEAFCGPRNFVTYNAVGVAARAGGGADLARLLELTGGGGAQDQLLPVALSAGEFPSHMGLYNGSQPGEDNYVCAATWVHERYALTLASCVAKWNATGTKQQALSVRAGEWNLNRSSTNERPMVVRQVERVHLFPRYHTMLLSANSTPASEHNLALVEWIKPIDYLEVAYIWPACQMQSRQALRTSACWAPVRNITLSEYFDADGEGETKLKRTVNMVEVPVKLYANNELECQRNTQIQYFNFLHPNFICSADARRSSWRTKLNSPEAYGSGVYCNEGGNLSLVSILHPISTSALANSTFGYMDLSYYRPWIRSVISGRAAY